DSGNPSSVPDHAVPSGLAAASSSTSKHVLDNGEEHDLVAGHSKEDERKAILKLDFIVLPLIVMFYFFSSLDRSNIGNARVAESLAPLGSSIFRGTYFNFHLVKVPANLALKRIGAHIFLPLISCAWGLVTFCQGFTTNFGGLVTARLFMGLAEGSSNNFIVCHILNCGVKRERNAYWITWTFQGDCIPDQLQMRIAIFYSSASVSGSFSGLLAYAILHLHDTWGKPAWAWLFFVSKSRIHIIDECTVDLAFQIEGAATMIFAVIASFIFPASISANRLLSDREKQILTDRLARKAPATLDPNEKLRWSEVLAAIKSPHVIILTMTQFMTGTAAYSATYFTPTTLPQNDVYLTSHMCDSLVILPLELNFCPRPPSLWLMLVGGYVSDRYHARALTAGVSAAVAFTGFMLFLLLDPSQTNAKYGSLFLAIPGVLSLIPPIGAWAANNSDGHYRRATAIAFSYSTSTVGGILSTWLFPHSQAPRYRPGIIVNLVCCAGIMLGVTLNYIWLRYANHYKNTHRSRILEPYDPDNNGIHPGSPQDLRAWAELGDKHPDFKYVY
ncbi:hypothetical protein PSTT_02118, partial [Puccinia striiformis]